MCFRKAISSALIGPLQAGDSRLLGVSYAPTYRNKEWLFAANVATAACVPARLLIIYSIIPAGMPVTFMCPAKLYHL